MSQSSTKNTNNGHKLVKAAPTEVLPKAKRRNFPAAYKRRILAEAERCTEPGQVGALLRREGLYASHLTAWRQQRDAGELRDSTAQPRGRAPRQSAAEQAVERLERENARLRQQLEQAELIIAAQKKLAQALEMTLTAPRGNKS